MGTPDLGQQHWLIGAVMLIVGGVASAITTVVNGFINRRTNAAAAARATAEAEKARAEAGELKVTAEIQLSDAAMRLVGGLHEEIGRMRVAHAEEITEIRAAHRLEMETLKEHHQIQLATLQERAEKAELEVALLRGQIAKLEARINAGGVPEVVVVAPIPEVLYETAGSPISAQGDKEKNR